MHIFASQPKFGSQKLAVVITREDTSCIWLLQTLSTSKPGYLETTVSRVVLDTWKKSQSKYVSFHCYPSIVTRIRKCHSIPMKLVKEGWWPMLGIRRRPTEGCLSNPQAPSVCKMWTSTCVLSRITAYLFVEFDDTPLKMGWPFSGNPLLQAKWVVCSRQPLRSMPFQSSCWSWTNTSTSTPSSTHQSKCNMKLIGLKALMERFECVAIHLWDGIVS